jgi:LPS-assembly protein
LTLFIWLLPPGLSGIRAEDDPPESPPQKKAEAPWNIEAKRLIYKAKEQVYEAEGDVVISRGDQILHAQKAVYNTKTGFAEVSGGVKLESGGNVLTGERGVFDLNKQTGMISNGSLFLRANHYYLTGKIVEKVSADTYVVEECRVTTCDGPIPAWSITSSKAKVTIESYGVVKDAAFRVYGLPVLYFPYMLFPGKTKRQSGLLAPRAGYDTRNGLDFELPFFWDISEDSDATFYQHYMTERGYMQGLEYRYVEGFDSKGVFLFDILEDKKEKDLSDPDDVEISPFPRTNETRYWFRAKADQDLPLGVSAHFDGDFVSDQDYLREFQESGFGYEARPNLANTFGRPVQSKYAPLRRSALRLSRDRGTYSLQGLASYWEPPQDPSGGSTPQPLTGINFQLLPERVMPGPLFFELQSQYDYIWRDKGDKGHQLSLSPRVNLPLWVGPYLQLEPFVGYAVNTLWFDQVQDGQKFQTQTAYQTGLSLFTNIERVYDLDWKTAKRVKHRIWPTLTYTYEAPQEHEEKNPWFLPMEAAGKVNQVTLSIENFLDARLENAKGYVDYVQWATLQLTQSYDINEERGDEEAGTEKKPFPPLEATMTVTAPGNVDFLGVTRWDHYDREITYADVSMDLSVDRYGGRKDTYALNYQLEKGISEAINFWVNINLAYGFEAGSSLSKDLRADQSISNNYWLGYHSQCWGVRFILQREENQSSFSVSFNLLGLGNVGGK